MKIWKLYGLCALLLVRSAEATVAIQLNGPELAAQADTIVHGRVVQLSGHVDTATNRVFTDAEVEVLLPLKGASIGTRLKVSYPGGVVQGLGMRVEGQIALKADREYVLYLLRARDGTFFPSAMRQGFYEINVRGYDGVRVAFRTLQGLSLVKREKGTGLTKLTEMPVPMEVPLVTLFDDIKRDLVVGAKLDRNQLRGLP